MLNNWPLTLLPALSPSVPLLSCQVTRKLPFARPVIVGLDWSDAVAVLTRNSDATRNTPTGVGASSAPVTVTVTVALEVAPAASHRVGEGIGRGLARTERLQRPGRARIVDH